MATKKVSVLSVPGADRKAFDGIFASYVQTGREESRGILSDFNGSIDPEGNFYITRRGKDTAERMNYEAHLTGKITADSEKNLTRIEYSTEMSRVFLLCMIVLGVLCAAFLTYALIAFFTEDRTGPLLPASFFTIAFVIVLLISVFRPECRKLESVLNQIVGEYAARTAA